MGGEISAGAGLVSAALDMFRVAAEWTGAIVIIITALAVLFLVTVVTVEKRKITPSPGTELGDEAADLISGCERMLAGEGDGRG